MFSQKGVWKSVFVNIPVCSELNHPYLHTNMLLENLIFTIYKLETGLREISEEHDALLMQN